MCIYIFYCVSDPSTCGGTAKWYVCCLNALAAEALACCDGMQTSSGTGCETTDSGNRLPGAYWFMGESIIPTIRDLSPPNTDGGYLSQSFEAFSL